MAFKFADIAASADKSGVPVWVFLAAMLTMLVALGVTARAVAIRVGEGLADPKTLAEDLELDPDDERTFLLNRCVDYAVAADSNSGVNDKRANLLEWAGWLIFGSIALHGLGAACSLVRSLWMGF